MEKRQFLAYLKAMGLGVEPGKGGESKVIVLETEDLVYGKLNLRKKTVTRRDIGYLVRAARRKGMTLHNYVQIKEGSWKPSKKKDRAKLSDLDIEDAAAPSSGFKSIEKLSLETGLCEEYLQKTLPEVLHPSAFWATDKNFVDYDAFVNWFFEQDFVPLTETIVALGGDASLANTLRSNGYLETVLGRKSGKKAYFARNKDIKRLAAGPLPRKRGTEPKPSSEPHRVPAGLTGKIKEVRAVREVITHEVAAETLKNSNDSIFQRTWNQNIYNMLEAAQRRGAFYTPVVNFAVYPNRKMKIVDGQHCLAIIRDFKLNKPSFVRYFAVEEDLQAWELYTTFNSSLSVKTQANFNKGLWEILKPPCPKGLINKLVSGINIFRNFVDKDTGEYRGHKTTGRIPADYSAVMVEEAGYHPYMELASHAIQNCLNPAVHSKIQIYSAMLYHYEIAGPEATFDFWNSVLSGAGYKRFKNGRKDPRLLLRHFLEEYSVSQRETETVKKHAGEATVFYTINRLWNLYREGRAISHTKLARTPVRAK